MIGKIKWAKLPPVKYKVRGTDPNDRSRFHEMYSWDIEKAKEQKQWLLNDGLVDVEIVEL